MRVALFILYMLSSFAYADEYDFDMSILEPKPYEYSGYLRMDDKLQELNNEQKDLQNYLHLEGLVNFSYTYEKIKFYTSAIATNDYIKNKLSKSDLVVNDLYLENKITQNHMFLLGKESLGWGKGYFFNPVAFFDRSKDPLQPTQSREGYILARYNYNKSFQSELKNISFDFVYLPVSNTLNSDYYHEQTKSQNATNIALKLYVLFYDIDIDMIYNYSDETEERAGFDFSTNLQTNFEMHGEYAYILGKNEYNYLLGLRYLTSFDLTIISEYLFQSEGLNKQDIQNRVLSEPFMAKEYWITLVTQKEPFDWLYFSFYYKNMMNLQDYSQQNKIGALYSFKNNIDLDISYNVNTGRDNSEFGKKNVYDFIWTRMTWSF